MRSARGRALPKCTGQGIPQGPTTIGDPTRAPAPQPSVPPIIMTTGRSTSAPPCDHTIEQELGFVRIGLARELEAIDTGLRYLLPKPLQPHDALICAPAILAIGLPHPDCRQALVDRCQLAVALELLGIALAVHHQLFDPQADLDALEQTAILAGDYYFARSAQLVTQMRNPPLLDAFAEVLKQASEQHLAHMTDTGSPGFEIVHVLGYHGILCGTWLRPEMKLEGRAIAEAWLALVTGSVPESCHRATFDALHRVVPDQQRERWRFATAVQ